MSPLTLQEELAGIASQDLFRKIRTLERIDSTRAVLNGREIQLFCSNDYLGLSYHPRIIAVVQKAVSIYGVGAGAARLISGSTNLHENLEKRLAELKQKEKALLFTTGYLANLGILTALAGKEDIIVMDKLCHASIVDGARLSGATIRVFPHKNYARLEEILSKAVSFRRRLVVTDTVFSMDGDLADIPELIHLKKKFDALLIVDDAHGTGVLGATGQGATEDINGAEEVDIVMGTLSKALGCLGGFACGNKALIDYLINFARPFIFATALPPMCCAASIEAIKILKEEPLLRERLWNNVSLARGNLKNLGFDFSQLASPILPLIVGEEKRAVEISESLLQEGFLVPAVRTPTVPRGKARLRLTISASHTQRDIEKICTVLKKTL
ncbi:MAG: 8-amino-7-oxononanoate synthase [Candidatus Omnitrophica bacterium]|nr:8-amino-7-oxononanoate synthase [Candidatus Omnitrophota bacterium]